MEQQFLKIDPNINEEQLYYPPLDFAFNPEVISPQEDEFFVDKTIRNEKEDCCVNRITRTDINTFKYKSLFLKMTVICTIVIGFLVGLTTLISGNFSRYSIFTGISSFLTCLIPAICIDCFGYCNINLKLEPNSIVLKKKSVFRRKTFVYNIGELERFALYYKYVKNEETYQHRYTLYFVKKEGKKDEYKEFKLEKMNKDFGGVKYFIDLVNSHIQNNMSF